LIYKVDKIIPKHTLSFVEVKGKVKSAYVDEKSLSLAKEHADQALQTLQKGKSLTALKAKTEEITRGDFALDSTLRTAIFSDGLKAYKLAQNGQSYWVYEVTKVIAGSDQLPAQVLQNNYTNAELNDYLTALKKQYPIKINHQLIQ
jgi:hypothetical protein